MVEWLLQTLRPARGKSLSPAVAAEKYLEEAPAEFLVAAWVLHGDVGWPRSAGRPWHPPAGPWIFAGACPLHRRPLGSSVSATGGHHVR